MIVDVFGEDAAHEELIKALLKRMAADEEVHVRARVRTARGGHPRVFAEYQTYQEVMGVTTERDRAADLLVVAIDGNCSSFADARKRILSTTTAPYRTRVVPACPDPHIERWYLADLQAFREVVGRGPTTVNQKCVRSHYKGILNSAIREAGHPASDGLEFAADIAATMDFYRAGKSDPSLKAFLDDLRAALRQRADAGSRTSGRSA